MPLFSSVINLFYHLFAIINKSIFCNRRKLVFSFFSMIASFFDVASCTFKLKCFNCSNSSIALHFIQKQPSINGLIKRCCEKYEANYRKTPMPKCDFNKVSKANNLHCTYVLIMSYTLFRMNSHYIMAWMSRNALLETGAISEV